MYLSGWGDILNIQKLLNGIGGQSIIQGKGHTHKASPPPWKSRLKGILSAEKAVITNPVSEMFQKLVCKLFLVKFNCFQGC